MAKVKTDENKIHFEKVMESLLEELLKFPGV